MSYWSTGRRNIPGPCALRLRAAYWEVAWAGESACFWEGASGRNALGWQVMDGSTVVTQPRAHPKERVMSLLSKGSVTNLLLVLLFEPHQEVVSAPLLGQDN